MTVENVLANTGQPLAWARELFIEYAASLPFDLAFQGFDEELAGLPGDYVRPDGGLLVALCDGAPAGCVAFHRWEQATCEMKRLYVRPAFRARGLGRGLAVEVIRLAAQAGYEKMLLDTVPAMTEARALYASLGFVETPPYRRNPVPGTAYLQLCLRREGLRCL